MESSYQMINRLLDILVTEHFIKIKNLDHTSTNMSNSKLFNTGHWRMEDISRYLEKEGGQEDEKGKTCPPKGGRR